MRRRSSFLLTLAAFIAAVGPLDATQSRSLRDLVREHGDIIRVVTSCGPPVGLKEIVQFTQLTVEGTVTLVESSLTAQEDSVYTDYVIEVIRVFRLPSHTATPATPGPTDFSPFVANDPQTQPTAATTLRVRLRSPNHGRVVLDGGVVTASSGFPTLTVGQHVIVSAYVDTVLAAWVPFGVFEVREGRVLQLGSRLQTRAYDSVEAFAAALDNPPPTIGR